MSPITVDFRPAERPGDLPSGHEKSFRLYLTGGICDTSPTRWTKPDAELIAPSSRATLPALSPWWPSTSAGLRHARRYARRESEIEDIVQEVFIKAFQKLPGFRGEAPFEHWLMRLTVRTLL